ncbi:MAG: methylenetetrahydrofolate reductase [Chloroflexi bacterium]|nr:methylenetetrahydrofolate reductase [Chloroflexota bacterium]MCY3936794.1 methylenetetrahydrofolate reductase [Chloroflexota bacterium]
MASKALLRDTGVSGGLLSHVQFEVVPAKGALRKVLRNLSPESRISISCSPTNGIAPTLRLHKRLTGKGYRPIPHVTARAIKSREHLREVMDALADTDTRGIMALGGDPDPPWGPYDSSFALLREIADMGRRFEFVGIAGYPQTHPVVPDDSLMQALTDKQPYATHVVTQMCFDARATLDWAARIRDKGVSLPIFIGIPSPMNALRLLELARTCGVSDARRFLKSKLGMVGQFLRPSYTPDKLLSKLNSPKNGRDLGFAGVHVFTFNQVEQARLWADPLLERMAQPAGAR